LNLLASSAVRLDQAENRATLAGNQVGFSQGAPGAGAP
jgi:hypothetical protein